LSFQVSFSVSAKERTGCEPSFPVIISDDVIVATGGGELPTFENLADAAATLDSPARGTEWVIFHAGAVKKDVVADKEKILENVEGEARGMTIDMEGLDSLMDEIFIEGRVKGEGPADFVY
jgi:hypothetical protein